jgi:hypothetical protein
MVLGKISLPNRIRPARPVPNVVIFGKLTIFRVGTNPTASYFAQGFIIDTVARTGPNQISRNAALKSLNNTVKGSFTLGATVRVFTRRNTIPSIVLLPADPTSNR